MAGTIWKYRGCEFTVWDKSLRMDSPVSTGLFSSYSPMSDMKQRTMLADLILDAMNKAVNHASSRMLSGNMIGDEK